MPLRASIRKHPILSASGIFALFMAGSILGGLVSLILALSTVGVLILTEVILSLLAVALISLLGWWRTAGIIPIGRSGQLVYLAPLVPIPFLSLIEGVKMTDPPTVVTYAILAFLVGFAEESFFRGLMIPVLSPVGMRKAVTVSALLFGIPHIGPALLGTWDPAFTVVNAFAAFGIGLSFGALFIRIKNLWPFVLIHAAIDLTALLTEGGIIIGEKPPVILALAAATATLLIIYGGWLLQGSSGPGTDRDIG